jgi:Rrf2 family protein
MLALNKKTGYALIALAHLAGLEEDELASARQIADRFGIPISLLMNVLKELAGRGWIESRRGAAGGYRMAVPAGRISLAQLVEAMEGPVPDAECKDEVSPRDLHVACPVLSRCPIADPVHRVHRRIHDFLQTVSLSDLNEPVAQPVGHEG